eukprot:517485_1
MHDHHINIFFQSNGISHPNHINSYGNLKSKPSSCYLHQRYIDRQEHVSLNLPNISITVQVHFITDPANNTERDPLDVIDSDVFCSSDHVEDIQINTKERKYHVIRIQSEDEFSVYGRGFAEINFCATDTHLKAFVFDEYPYII